MSGIISEIPKDSCFLWPCCRECGHKEKCSYVYDQILCHAARQGLTEAQRLTALSSRFLDTFSCSADIRRLLDSGKDLENALSQALFSEIALLGNLCNQTGKYCPQQSSSISKGI